MAAKRDYYEVLGVPRTANDEDIKKAFRNKAMEYHPDRNREAGATEKFKEINEAYQTLSDPDARTRYDRFGHQGVNGAGGSGFEGFSDFGGFGDIFESFFGGASSTRETRGRDLEYVMSVSFKDAVFGAARDASIRRREICGRCSGSRGEPGSNTATCVTCGGTGRVRRVQKTLFGNFEQITECASCRGIGKTIDKPCIECRAAGVADATRKISIDIPAGVDDGTRIVMRGHGDVGDSGTNPGDLYVRVHVEPDRIYTRIGDDVLIRVELNVVNAMLGATITIPTLEGEREIEVAPGTQTGHHIRLTGLGIPRLRNDGPPGDQIVQFEVVTPRSLTLRQRELVEELGNAMLETDERALDPLIVENEPGNRGGDEGNGSGIWDFVKGAFTR